MQNLKFVLYLVRTNRYPNIFKIAIIAATILMCCTMGFAQSSDWDVTSFLPKDSGPNFNDPFQIWVRAGYAYVTDLTDSVVKRVSLSTGAVTILAGKPGEFASADGIGPEARFGQPAGVWADDRNVYVTDAYFGSVRQISLATGQVTTLAGSPGSPSGFTDGIGTDARFNSPNGLWGDGVHLFVCDTLNFTLRKIVLATGEVTTVAGAAEVRGTADGVRTAARFYAPLDIWGDGEYLYVSDAGTVRKVVIDTGEVRTLAGVPPIGYFADAGSETHFSFISGIWGDGVNLFVADSGSDVIRKVSLATGETTTIAGRSDRGGNANGRGQEARFDNPTDVAGDGSTIYIVDRMNSDIKRATAAAGSPTTPTGAPSIPMITGIPTENSQMKFQLQNRGGESQVTFGERPMIQAGYGLLTPEPGSSAPSGLAVFGYRRDGVLVSEASVPASQLIYSGRIAAQISDVVNTGVAMANPYVEAAALSFYLTDEKGTSLYSGTAYIPAGGLIAAFLNQSPFAPPAELGINLADARTFTFTSSLPLGVTAIRGFTNERSDFLVTTLPVVTLGTLDSAPIAFAHYAQGGGWKTQLVLINPTETVIAGAADFFNQAASGNTRQTLPYSIAPRSATTIPLADGSDMRTGWIRVTPSEGMPSPSGISVFSFQTNGITVTEAGVPALPESSASRLYVEASGNFKNGEAGSIQTGFALSNSSDAAANVTFELFGLDGNSTGLRAETSVPANGQIAMFVDQLPAFQDLRTPFQGFLRISGSSVAVVGLRSRYNERGDFLITTTAPTSESSASSSTEAMFPYFVDGGGYTTQFVLFSGATGQGSNGTLNFFSATGEPLALPLHK